jgi:hypothetical protein
MKTGDKVKLRKNGLMGTIEDRIVDHVTGIPFYVVQFADGQFEIYTSKELTRETLSVAEDKSFPALDELNELERKYRGCYPV